MCLNIVVIYYFFPLLAVHIENYSLKTKSELKFFSVEEEVRGNILDSLPRPLFNMYNGGRELFYLPSHLAIFTMGRITTLGLLLGRNRFS